MGRGGGGGGNRGVSNLPHTCGQVSVPPACAGGQPPACLRPRGRARGGENRAFLPSRGRKREKSGGIPCSPAGVRGSKRCAARARKFHYQGCPRGGSNARASTHPAHTAARRRAACGIRISWGYQLRVGRGGGGGGNRGVSNLPHTCGQVSVPPACAGGQPPACPKPRGDRANLLLLCLTVRFLHRLPPPRGIMTGHKKGILYYVIHGAPIKAHQAYPRWGAPPGGGRSLLQRPGDGGKRERSGGAGGGNDQARRERPGSGGSGGGGGGAAQGGSNPNLLNQECDVSRLFTLVRAFRQRGERGAATVAATAAAALPGGKTPAGATATAAAAATAGKGGGGLTWLGACRRDSLVDEHKCFYKYRNHIIK